MKEFYFKAIIPLTEIQRLEAKKMDGTYPEYATIYFTLKDLVDREYFSIRTLLKPWLAAGNIPELISKGEEK